MVPFDFQRPLRQSHHLQGVLIGSDPVNFGSWSLFPDNDLVFKFGNGLLRLAIFYFALPDQLANTPIYELLANSPTPPSLRSGVQFNTMPLFDSVAFENENPSASALREGPISTTDDLTLVVTYSIRNLTPLNSELIAGFKRLYHRFITPWVVSPSGHAASFLHPVSQAHRQSVLDWLSQSTHQGLLMVM